jgi:GrpB-like predicted nucleotidyltransferase (UPF0157 family)
VALRRTLGLRVRAISLVPYDPAWPAAFAALRDLAVARLGDLVLEVHHVGSTSIPGLIAKPKIDVDIVLTSAAVIAAADERLSPFGYEHHGDAHGDGMWCLTKSHGAFGERMYLSGPEHPVHLARLRFRDYLAAHPDAATAYGALKLKLAAEAADDWERYGNGKTAFVEDILSRASQTLRR